VGMTCRCGRLGVRTCNLVFFLCLVWPAHKPCSLELLPGSTL
jgi:hypothetical protein